MINIGQQISSVERRMGSRVLEAGTARVQTISRTYQASLDELWDACTNPERLPRWFAPVSGDLTLHGRYQLEGNAGGVVQRCDPPKSFAATWEFGGEVSWIEVRLTPQSDSETRFELEHVAHIDDERWAQFGPGATGVGWDLALLGLDLHLSDPQTAMDPQAAEEWSTSAEGREFITRSSEQWRQASIAEGTDPALASEAAARTTAFYTGTA
ncbi:SRPBCC family protein [Micromonospora sp. NBC_01813]|uniref:SRPBCC family protein n=1 Tax=Micromonospora sp. NBC_01813 TaxID=2975988 RepID=UPI002DD9339F|nr:SRPBCC family protein [Micromonospora sp. NBC_01813]WSA11944.1 SRPBCC family protein [Micromonospora sp. NBC_01813]